MEERDIDTLLYLLSILNQEECYSRVICTNIEDQRVSELAAAYEAFDSEGIPLGARGTQFLAGARYGRQWKGDQAECDRRFPCTSIKDTTDTLEVNH